MAVYKINRSCLGSTRTLELRCGVRLGLVGLDDRPDSFSLTISAGDFCQFHTALTLRRSEAERLAAMLLDAPERELTELPPCVSGASAP